MKGHIVIFYSRPLSFVESSIQTLIFSIYITFRFSGNDAMFVYLQTTYNDICDWLRNYYVDFHWLVLFIKQPARK